MSKPFRLQPILDLAEKEAEKSAARLGTLNLQKQKVESKLNLLLHYREDYLARFRSGMQDNPIGDGWRNFHDFMDKLDAAITQQQAIVGHAQDMMLKGQAEFRDRQRRVKAFDTLAGRHRETESLRDSRAEQRALDELAAAVSARGGRGGRSGRGG
ncbi:MAG: flagellar export protein FliJ [Burkholderiales bacterium]|nr:flagellar export protein FliJ [Burkholderiales bacterium]